MYKRGIIYLNSNPYIIWFDLDKNIYDSILLPMKYEILDQCIGVTDEGILTFAQMINDHSVLIWMMTKDGEWVQRYHFLEDMSMDILCLELLPFLGGDKYYMQLTLNSMGSKKMLCYYNIITGEIVMIKEIKDHQLFSIVRMDNLKY